MARMKTALDIIQLWFIYFAASFLKAFGNVNVKHLKIPEKHRGPHETPSRAACLRPLIYVVYFFNIWLVWSNIRNSSWMQERQKNLLKYSDFTELKKITNRIYSICSNYFSLFFKSFKFRCCSFCFIKKILLTVQVCCLF